MNKYVLSLIIVVVIAAGLVYTFTKSSKNETKKPSENAAITKTAVTSNKTASPCEKGNLTSSGSTALAPLVQAVAKKYQENCKDAHITVNLGGSGTGLANVENGSSDIGNSDIFAKEGQEDLVDHQVAVALFAIIVNSKVTVKGLTTEQIKGIYAGTTTNWKEVGGSDLPIVVVSRPTSSGTRATFQKYVLGGPETVSGPESLTTDSAGTVIKNVQQNDGAIGYVGTGPAKKAGLTMLKIDNVEPTADNVKNGSYKYWNIEHMYTKGEAKPLAKSLIDYMLSDDAKAAAASLDYMAISDVSQDLL